MSLADECFEKWTRGRGEKEARISVFEHIRDIPYAVTQSAEPEEMLRKNRGFCVPKHLLLADFLKRLGVKARFAFMTFRWSEAPQLTPELGELAKRYADVRGHLACYALIGERWVLVDATWDKPLARLGFPVNEWDGEGDTEPAVKPIEPISFSNEYYPFKGPRPPGSMRFYDKLNKWLEKARSV